MFILPGESAMKILPSMFLPKINWMMFEWFNKQLIIHCMSAISAVEQVTQFTKIKAFQLSSIESFTAAKRTLCFYSEDNLLMRKWLCDWCCQWQKSAPVYLVSVRCGEMKSHVNNLAVTDIIGRSFQIAKRCCGLYEDLEEDMFNSILRLKARCPSPRSCTTFLQEIYNSLAKCEAD